MVDILDVPDDYNLDIKLTEKHRNNIEKHKEIILQKKTISDLRKMYQPKRRKRRRNTRKKIKTW